LAGAAGIVLDLFARTEHHRYGPSRLNRADLHVPRDGSGPHPVVVLIHGGYWRATYGKIVMKPLAADLVRRGYATWNIEYRRIGRRQGGGYPATFDDVRAALRRLAELDDERLDLTDLTLIGHSAGGHLALWVAGRDDAGLQPRRMIAQAPVVNLVAAGAPAHALLGGTPDEVPERYAECDPMRLPPLPIPVLIVHGATDATVPLRRSVAYAEAARAAGGDVELIEPSEGGHRAHIDPRSQAWRLALEWLERSRGAVSPLSSAPPAAR
jgi:acetyl esterase/lipase